MGPRCLLLTSSRLGTRSYRPSLPCCYAWYSSIHAEPQSPPPSRRSSTKSTQASKQRTTLATSSQKAATPIEKAPSNSKAFSRLTELLRDSLTVLDSTTPPSEAVVLESLVTCRSLARYFKNVKDSPDTSDLKTNSAAENLLFLERHDSKSSPSASAPGDAPSPSSPPRYIASTIASDAMAKISKAAWDLVRDQKVFITPNILKLYVEIQALLSHPETLAEAFSLYASKPIPTPGSVPVKYVRSNPNKISTAVPIEIATTALNAAIQSENLPLCLDIVEKTVCTTSYKRAKVVRRALIPGVGLSLAPIAAYSVASQFSLFQESMSSANATGVAFAGVLAYVGATSTIGIVALTTANDHMDRVTWAGGTPLRERWIREDERQMLDLIAAAWGFKESWRRGEEEGPEWQALKELVAIRGMVLDKVELMEGME